MIFYPKALLGPFLLILTALQACGPTELQDMDLEDQAAEYAQFDPGFRGGASILGPGDIGAYLLPADGAVLLDIGLVRVVLLGREDHTGYSSLMRVSGNEPKAIGNGKPFSFDYANGLTKCEVYGLPFTCSDGKLHIAGQAYSYDDTRVVLVNAGNEVVFSQVGDHTGLTLRGAPVLPADVR